MTCGKSFTSGMNDLLSSMKSMNASSRTTSQPTSPAFRIIASRSSRYGMMPVGLFGVHMYTTDAAVRSHPKSPRPANENRPSSEAMTRSISTPFACNVASYSENVGWTTIARFPRYRSAMSDNNSAAPLPAKTDASGRHDNPPPSRGMARRTGPGRRSIAT